MRLGIVTDQVIAQPQIGFRLILRRMEMVERFVPMIAVRYRYSWLL
jgi:hypothetical protein